MNSNSKALSALCYFSVLFAPFLLPIIVYFVVDDTDVKHHAKRAFMSHLLSVILAFILVVIYFFIFLNTPDQTLSTALLVLLIAVTIIFIIAYAIIFIWNIIQAVKVMR